MTSKTWSTVEDETAEDVPGAKAFAASEGKGRSTVELKLDPKGKLCGFADESRWKDVFHGQIRCERCDPSVCCIQICEPTPGPSVVRDIIAIYAKRLKAIGEAAKRDFS
jgi:hypothetical protein